MSERAIPRQADTLDRVLEARIADLHVMVPGKVRSYDRGTQTAEIEIQVKRVIAAASEDEADTAEDYPILPSVPVAHYRAGGFAIHADLTAGDFVWIVFAEVDFNRWRETGAVSDPGVSTRHPLSGAVAFPGAFTRSGTNPDASSNPRIGKIGGPRIEWNGSAIEAGGSQALALKTQTDAQLAALAADVATLAAAIALCQPGTSPTPTTTIAGVRASNPIGSSVLKGA